MPDSFPKFAKFDLNVFAKMTSERKALCFQNSKSSVNVQTQYEEDGISEAYENYIMGNGVEITQEEFNLEFAKVIERLINLNQ